MLLAVAVIVTGASTFVSCKDYEDEDTQQLRFSMENLNADFAAQVKALQDKINALTQKLDTLKGCDCKPQDINNIVGPLTERLDSLAEASKTYALKTQITNINNELNILKGLGSTNPAWKDSINNLQAEIERLRNSIPQSYNDQALRDSISSLRAEINMLKGNVGKGFDDQTLTDYITALEKRVADLEGKETPEPKPYDDKELKDAIKKIQNDLAILSKIDTTQTKDIKALQTKVATLETGLNSKLDSTWKQNILKLEEQVKNMATQDDLNKYIDSTKSLLSQMESRLTQQIAQANEAAGEAKELAQKAQAAAQAAQASADAAQGTANQAQKDATQALKDAADAAELANNLYKQAVQSINTLSQRVDDLDKATVDIATALVTQVIVQSTYSPAVGELALPLDIQANALVTYYGSSDEAFSFPTRNSKYFLNDADLTTYGITAEDVTPKSGESRANVPQGTFITDDEKTGNAGSLYVTVNPSTVDISGVKFALVNSRGEKSSVELGNATPSDELLTWGYTRASGNNFYKIPARITKEDLNDDYVKINFQGAELRSTVRKLLNDRTQTKATLKQLAKNVVKFVYENMNGVMPRLAVSTEYSVGTKNNKATLHNVSEMNILAGAVKPVGMGALDNVNITSTPGLERVESTFSRFINSIKLGTLKLDVPHTQIQKIRNIGHLTRHGRDYEIKVGYTYYDPETKTIKNDTSIVNINNQIDDLLKAVDDTLTKANNDAVDHFNSAIDEFNDVMNSLQTEYDLDERYASQKQSIINRVDNYLTRINDRFVYWFNRTSGAALKPVMLFEANNNVHRLLAGETGTRVKGSSITLIPTTYTYELLAPAYKKFVKVYDKNTKSVLYGKVISGTDKADREITINGLQSGHSYYVVYETVDYRGKVVIRKYTVNVD